MRRHPRYVDLHMHSTVSDGTDSPAQLLRKVREAGMELFSLTDHDAFHGCEQIREQLAGESARGKSAGSGAGLPAGPGSAAAKICGEENFPAFIAGVEFSCRDVRGKYHILGYGYDLQAPPIRELVQKGHALRMRNLSERLRILREDFGIELPEELRRRLESLSNPGKPHVANALVELGLASDRNEAISRYLDRIRFRRTYISPEEAIRVILESGGVPVLAHPFFGSGSENIRGETMEARLRCLMEFGLQGVEAFYSGFDREMIHEMIDFADKYDLMITAGSDYHGKNKRVRLGETNLQEADLCLPGLQRFFDRIRPFTLC